MFIIVILLALSSLFASVSFIIQPSLDISGQGYNVVFELDTETDVEVSIVNTVTEQVVRHLAAGVLGAKAPAPLQQNSLGQSIFWDGLDDFGNTVPNVSECRVRVRAGMNPVVDKFVGEQHYMFHRSINGIATTSDGKVLVYGSYPRPSHHGTTMMTLRRYSQSRNYEKTLWPVPAGLPANYVSPLGIVMQPDGGYLPRTESGDVPQLGGTPLSYEESAMLTSLIDDAALIYEFRDFRYYLIGQNGSVLDTGRLIKQPALPIVSQYTGPWPSGPVYLSLSPDRKYFLLSGYSAKYYDSTKTSWWPSDTGFWREGQIYKIDFATGIATPFITHPLDSLPKTVADRRSTIGPLVTTTNVTFMSSFHGTAFDNSGRIYVCDRLRKEVGVYDTNGTKLSSLPVVDPDVVAVSTRTGAVYVVSRQYTAYQIGTSKLTKFSSWSDTTRVVLGKAFSNSIMAKTTVIEDERKGPVAFTTKINICLDDNGDKTIIWINSLKGSNALVDSSLVYVRAFEDNGTSLTKIDDFHDRSRGQSSGYDRVAVDRKTETVFINDSWDMLYKVNNWDNPVPQRCRTTGGAFLDASDMTVSPDGRYLYISRPLYPYHKILRYYIDSLHLPAIFPSKGTNVAVDSVKQRYGAGRSDRGLAVTPSGKIYVITSQDTLLIFDTTGVRVNDTLLKTAVSVGGIRTDLKENLYVAMLLRSPEHVIPTEYQSYFAYTKGAGAVVKMRPDTQVTVNTNSNLALRVPLGADKVYPQVVTPFSNVNISTVRVPSVSSGCVCRRPRYDVDPYGRLYMPNTVIAQVNVADNEGNTIASFGSYGNVDSKGSGSMIPEPAIPFAWPIAATASEDYIYVTDMINARLVRLKMNYSLDNMPGFSVRKNAFSNTDIVKPSIDISPNPFNPDCMISLSLTKNELLEIAVYSSTGKLVKKLANGKISSGKNLYRWDGTNEKGERVSAGLYIFRAVGLNTTLTSKGVLAR